MISTLSAGITCRAFLFDLDGVLVDSRQCVELIWAKWAAGRGLDPAPIIRAAHGRRTSETLRESAPGLDAAKEAALLDRMEETETGGIFPVPGAVDLLRRIPPGRWAIVTSGSTAVATLRMRIGGIPLPSVFITAADVREGKPSPEGYQSAAARLGFTAEDCIVIEDTPAGILAGKNAGMRVIAVQGTFGPGPLSAADHIVHALSALMVNRGESGTLTVAAAGLDTSVTGIGRII